MPKRYYWLKLKDDFFDSKRIKKLRKLAGGDTYLIIYLKMQLAAIHDDGYIKYSGIEKSFAEELALDLDEDADNVAVTLNYLQNVGLLETSDNIDFFLPFAVENTGSESASTQRSRECRARKSVALQHECNKLQQNCNVEKETETKKDISFIHSDDEKIKAVGGELGKGVVMLSEKQQADLLDKLSLAEFDKYVGIVAECELSGKKFKKKSHYQAILDMVEKDRRIAT